MPNIQDLSNFVQLNIGTFEKGKWDYIGLAQLYPELEVLGQLVPRKEPISNHEMTVVYQIESDSSGAGARPGDPVQPINRKLALRRKVRPVKRLDSIGWTLDQDALQGKSDEHIVRELQMQMVAWDLLFWQDLEHMLLQSPGDGDNDDDADPMYGLPAWVTPDADLAAGGFELYGGDDPYNTGRPGGISVAQQPQYTNAAKNFQTVSDDDFFEGIDQFLLQRKLMGAVPNPRLVPDTPSDVIYVQLKVRTAIGRYLTASNENIGMDAGRYRGQPTYKGIPIVLWHALNRGPVAPATCRGYLIDWNSFRYGVHPQYDRKISGPKEIDKVPGSQYLTMELWHQLVCDRPDRNLFIESDSAAFTP